MLSVYPIIIPLYAREVEMKTAPINLKYNTDYKCIIISVLLF